MPKILGCRGVRSRSGQRPAERSSFQRSFFARSSHCCLVGKGSGGTQLKWSGSFRTGSCAPPDNDGYTETRTIRAIQKLVRLICPPEDQPRRKSEIRTPGYLSWFLFLCS